MLRSVMRWPTGVTISYSLNVKQNTISLLSASNMSRHNKRKMPVKLKSFSGILVGNYLSLIPNFGVLAQLYLLAPIQNAVVERTFSFQNLILSARRNRLLLETVSKKILLKYCKLILSKEEINKIIETAAIAWLNEKKRKKGSGIIQWMLIFSWF